MLALALSLLGCGDDDGAACESPASCRDATVTIDSGDRDSGAIDAGEPDAEAEQCVTEVVELQTPPSGFPDGFSATRLPLAVLCVRACPTLASFDARYQCEPITADADAGSAAEYNMVRTEGCGTVAYDSPPDSWPRHYHFDAQTGALIGLAQLDDIGQTLPGSTCDDAAFVAGTIKPSCTNVTVQHCR